MWDKVDYKTNPHADKLKRFNMKIVTQYVLLIGNPVDGVRLIGLFATSEGANAYGDTFHKNDEFWIASCKSPWRDKD